MERLQSSQKIKEIMLHVGKEHRTPNEKEKKNFRVRREKEKAHTTTYKASL